LLVLIVLGQGSGSAIAGTRVGWIANRWDWNGVFVTMVVCCVLTMVFKGGVR